MQITNDWLLERGFFMNANDTPEIHISESVGISISTGEVGAYKWEIWIVAIPNDQYWMIDRKISTTEEFEEFYKGFTGKALTITQNP